jgi:hypothetical protein
VSCAQAYKGIPWWAIILGLLLVTNLGWLSWNVVQPAGLFYVKKQFRVEVLHTNGMDGIGLFDANPTFATGSWRTLKSPETGP